SSGVACDEDSSRRSSTPHVKAPCDPPPCRANATLGACCRAAFRDISIAMAPSGLHRVPGNVTRARRYMRRKRRDRSWPGLAYADQRRRRQSTTGCTWTQLDIHWACCLRCRYPCCGPRQKARCHRVGGLGYSSPSCNFCRPPRARPHPLVLAASNRLIKMRFLKPLIDGLSRCARLAGWHRSHAYDRQSTNEVCSRQSDFCCRSILLVGSISSPHRMALVPLFLEKRRPQTRLPGFHARWNGETLLR